MILWWVGNALIVLALPIVLIEARKIIRSLNVVKAAARDIAGSVHVVGGAVPLTMSTLSRIAERCRRLEAAVH